MMNNDKRIIKVIRIIGYVILSAIAIDIIFFKHRYICQTIFGSGLFAVIGVILAEYKRDYRNHSISQKIVRMVVVILIASILFFIWYKT